MKEQTTADNLSSHHPLPSTELMAIWLQLIHKATAKKLISFRERMQLLLLYVEVEKRLGLQNEQHNSSE
jgi:hypothetical protein